jgi:integrase
MATHLTYDRKNNRFSKMAKGITYDLPGQRWKSTIGITATEAQAEWNQFLADQRNGVLTKLVEVRKERQEIEQSGPSYESMMVTVSDLGPLVSQFITFKASMVSAGQVVVLKSHLKYLLNQIKTTTLTIDAWEAMLADLNQRKKTGKWSGKYCHDVLVTIKSFYRWAKKRMDVPTWIDDRDNNIEIPKAKIKFFTRPEIKSLLDSTDDEFRTIILIALNCSCTQEDISQLKWEMIDLENGTLTRMRTKHKHRGENDEALTVVYSLWPEIVSWLKSRKNKDGLVFTRPDGTALVQKNRNDQIAKTYRNVATKVGQTKTFKHLRKTGATILGGHVQYRIWREVYLCNAAKSVTDTSYDGTTALPAEITEYLRSQII